MAQQGYDPKDHCLALQDILECLIVELAQTKLLDADKMFERVDFIAAARRAGPETEAVGALMYKIGQLLRSKVDRPPGLPPIPDEEPKPS